MKSERGQALILIAFGIVAMLGLTALALDGGNAYADRRRAQNAADTAALTAALAKIGNQDWNQAALVRASNNNYDNNGISNTVTVHNPPIEGPYVCPAPNCNDYIQVVITSTVDTWFAKILGINQMNNRVQAVARAKPLRPYYSGNAVVALSPGDGKDNTPELKLYGGALVDVSGSGIFVNSSDNCSITSSNNTDISLPSIEVVGTACGISGISTSTVPQVPYPPNYDYLDDLCSRPNAVHISGDFPKNSTPETLPSNTIYCISGDFSITSNNTVLNGTGITFVIAKGVNINGGELNISSPSNLPLFYLPYASNKVGDNKYNVTINGNTGMLLRGQFLAPASHCKINGTSGTSPLQGQLICYTLELGGTADTYVIYNDIDNMDEPPQIELTE
jgi:Flp pilus assembly protein TadG